MDHNQSYKLLRTNNKLKGYLVNPHLSHAVPVLSPAEQDLNTENLKCKYLKKGSVHPKLIAQRAGKGQFLTVIF